MSTGIIQTRKNIIFSLILKVTEILVPFIIRTIIIKVLGAEYLGLNSLFTSILQVLSLAELGMSSAIVFCMYKPIAEENNSMICALYNWIKKVYKIIGIIVLSIGLLCLPFLRFLINGDVPQDINIYILYLLYLFNTVISYLLFAYKNTLLTAYQRVDKISISGFVCNIIMYSFQIVSLLLFKNYYLYIIFLPLSTILKNVIVAMITKKLFPQIKATGSIDSDQKKELSKMIVGLLSYKIGGVCRNSFDSIAISSILGLVVLGLYNNYYYIVTAVSGIIVVMVNAMIPTIGASIVKNDKLFNFELLEKLTYIFEWITFICSCCMVGIFQDFIRVWIGETYLFDDNSMLIIVLYFFVLIISEIIFMFRQATGIWWKDKFRPIVESVLNLVLNFVLVFWLGALGVVLGTIISIVFVTIPWGTKTLFNSYFGFSAKKYLTKLLFSSILSIILIYVCYFICTIIDFSGILGICLKLAICLLYSMIVFPIVHILDNRQKKAFVLIKLVIREKNNANYREN